MLRLKIDKYYTSLNGLLLLLWIEITKYSVSSGLENIANTVEWIKHSITRAKHLIMHDKVEQQFFFRKE